MKDIDILVIGGGQAGLCVGYYLRKLRKNFLIVDVNKRGGDSWRKRYDSLRLLTPNKQNSLPGLKISGRADYYPSKNEFADYLEKYAKYFELPIINNLLVEKVIERNGLFEVWAGAEAFQARAVVVATGAFQTPFVPEGFKNHKSLYVAHSGIYKNSKQIPPGNVLVVGAGDFGTQVAVELSSSHQVILSSNKSLVFSSRLDFLYVLASKLFSVRSLRRFTEILKVRKNQVVGFENLVRKGKVKLVPELIRIKGQKARFKGGTSAEFQSIIWAIGYKFDFSWIKIPRVFDKNGRIKKIKGLYFVYPERDYGFIRDLPERAQRLVKKLNEEN